LPKTMSKVKPKGKQVAHVSKAGLKKSPIKKPERAKPVGSNVSRDYSFARTN